MVAAEQITVADAEHGEGPVWSSAWGGLRWVDMLNGDILHLDHASGRVDRWHIGTVAAAIRPRVAGGLVAATDREFVIIDEIGGEASKRTEVFSDSSIRFNEGSCDPDGNFLCGTMAYDVRAGAGTMYRLSADGRVDELFSDVTISNGLAFTASGDTAYYVDTPTGRIDRFDYDSPTGLQNRRPLVTIPAELGSPDGLCVDAEGGIWVALWQGHAVHRYTAEERLDAVIDVPVSQVTACTFGGDDLDELYITTSRYDRDPAENPAAGAVFRAEVGVRGLPVRQFAG
jgi:sugar lactone lactonase YvrE